MFLLDVCQALARAKADFAIAGGYAVVLHGVVRGTIDVDLVVTIDAGNLKRIETVLNDLGLQSRIPVSATDIFRFRKEYIEKRNLVAWSFVDSNNFARVVDIILTADLKRMRKAYIQFGAVKIPVLAKKDLVRMKREAGRDQDLEDVRALEALDEES